MSDAEMQEWEAIRRAKGGDDVGYEALYRLHKRGVNSVCRRSTSSVPDAEEFGSTPMYVRFQMTVINNRDERQLKVTS